MVLHRAGQLTPRGNYHVRQTTLSESVNKLGTNLGEAASDVVDIYRGLQDARDQAYTAIGTAAIAPPAWAAAKLYEENQQIIDLGTAATSAAATNVRDGAANTALSVGQKAGEIKDGAVALGTAASEKSGEIINGVVHTSTRVGEGIGNLASQVREGAENAFVAVRDGAVETGTSVRNHAEKRPVTSALEIAASPFLPSLFITDAMARAKFNN